MPKLTGMFSPEGCSWFSTEKPQEFERRLLNWIRAPVHNPVLFFNRSSLNVGTVQPEESGFIYQVKIQNLQLEYIFVNDEMCILRRVIQTDSMPEKIIYTLPDSWCGISPFYSD